MGDYRIGHVQRARILASVVDVVAEHGLSESPVARIVAGSGVSRRTFYELFSDREHCFLAALEEVLQHARAEVIAGYRAGAEGAPREGAGSGPGDTTTRGAQERHLWRERIRAALARLLGLLDAEPNLARVLIVESFGAGPRVQKLRERILSEPIPAIEEGRQGSRVRGDLTAEGIVGALLFIVHARIVEGSKRPLIELTSPLMAVVVGPYLGPAAAAHELSRPAPKPAPAEPTSRNDLIGELPMRLTYRTLRVLAAIAEHPGASNRTVGFAGGVDDPGQISKLLRRLQRLGLVENRAQPVGRGEPNAWMLTARGEGVERAFRRPSAELYLTP